MRAATEHRDEPKANRRSRFAASTRALRVWNFKVFFVGETISSVGSWTQMVAQNWFILQITGSGKALGFTVALQMLPILLLGAWTGALADHVDNRRVLLVTTTAGAVQAIALGVLTASGHITAGWIYFFAFVLGTVGAFERPCAQAMNYALVGPTDLPSAVGLQGTIMASGRLIGPAIAGVLMATAGIEPVFFLNAFTFGAVIVALLLLRVDQLFPRRPTKDRARVRDGLAYVWTKPVLRLGLAVMFVVGTFAYNFAIMLPSMVRFEFGAGSVALGVVFSVSAVGAVTGGLAAAALYHPTARTLGLVTIGFGLCVAASALAPGLAAFVLLSLPLGAGSAVFTAVTQTILQQGSAPEYQGRVMSLFTIAWIGTTPIGGLMAGVVIDALSARAALGIGASAALLAGLVALGATRRLHEPSATEADVLHTLP